LAVVAAAAAAVLAAAAVATLAAAARRGAGDDIGDAMLNKIKTLIRHAWPDASDAQRAIPPAMLERLTTSVAASEGRHTGQIRIYVEAALPVSYLWRMGKTAPVKALIRQRAVMLFSKLGVWDTEHNNGVLIYLLLAERAIEIVADRGLSAHVTDADWQAMLVRMRHNFQQDLFEDGLTQAIAEVSALLVTYFPEDHSKAHRNELPDEPTLG